MRTYRYFLVYTVWHIFVELEISLLPEHDDVSVFHTGNKSKLKSPLCSVGFIVKFDEDKITHAN